MLKQRSIFFSALVSLILIMSATQTASAGLVGTQQLLPFVQPQQDLLIARQAIENQLIELGVEQDQARQRAAALSDSQVSDISNKLSDLPAGADAGSTILTIFFIFVITDVIGATDIFSFIHPVK